MNTLREVAQIPKLETAVVRLIDAREKKITQAMN